MASAIFDEPPVNTSSPVTCKLGTYMPMAGYWYVLVLLHTWLNFPCKECVVSLMLVLLCQWDWEGIFCNLSHSLKTKTGKGANFQPSTLTTKAFPKDRLFWNSLTCQIKIWYDNSNFYIFTGEGSERAFYWYFFRKHLLHNHRNHSTNMERFPQIHILAASDVRLLFRSPLWGWAYLVVTLVRASSETSLSAVCMGFWPWRIQWEGFHTGCWTPPCPELSGIFSVIVLSWILLDDFTLSWCEQASESLNRLWRQLQGTSLGGKPMLADESCPS